MNTHTTTADTEPGKSPTRKAGPSKKTTAKKAQPKATPANATNAATIAKAHNVNPKQLRKALREKGIRAPYDASAILKIEKIAKELAFVG